MTITDHRRKPHELGDYLISPKSRYAGIDICNNAVERRLARAVIDILVSPDEPGHQRMEILTPLLH
jgi:hypothetical protein